MTRPVFLEPPPTSPEPRFLWRDVRRRLPAMGSGLVAGALAGFFLHQLGVGEVLGDLSLQLLVLVPALLGAVLGGFRLQRAMLAFDVLLVVVFLIVADTPLMYGLATQWVRNDRPTGPLDAIVVLSASVNSDGALNVQGVQRLLTGLELYQAGVAPRLFTTAVEETYGSVVRSSTADQERLISLAGARPAWTSLTGVYSTRDEAMASASQLPAGAHAIAVVTSPMHTRRACATFEAVGFRVTCVASREHDFVAWHPLSPRDRLESFRQYFYERLGMVKYRAKGWIAKQD
jgi:uncharacterized SAM-binding protein YcdF (DUF218 family)